tara:strand:- start:297 stop:1085 length:789 start_codon:yes stop_codon:yes gene_type:complete
MPNELDQDHVKALVGEIITLRDHSDYRITDVFLSRGERWEPSAEQVVSNPKYKGTVLKKYLDLNGVGTAPDIRLFYSVLKDHARSEKIPLPHEQEVVVHLRLGDVVVHDWYLSKDYVQEISRMLAENPEINTLSIVTCFVYAEWSEESLHLRKKSPLWVYTEEKQTQNVTAITTLLSSIRSAFPQLRIKIVSNSDIDCDIAYCVFSKSFIKDHGGISNLIMILHRYHLSRKNVFSRFKYHLHSLLTDENKMRKGGRLIRMEV